MPATKPARPETSQVFYSGIIDYPKSQLFLAAPHHFNNFPSDLIGDYCHLLIKKTRE